jgi:hypothetical protein
LSHIKVISAAEEVCRDHRLYGDGEREERKGGEGAGGQKKEDEAHEL